jgi:hypothetical protein
MEMYKESRLADRPVRSGTKYRASTRRSLVLDPVHPPRKRVFSGGREMRFAAALLLAGALASCGGGGESVGNSGGGVVTLPTVSIISPASAATVSGTIDVEASTADNSGVVGVELQLDGMTGAEDTTAPYSATWDTTTAANGAHTLTAVARDATGTLITSAPVTVTVTNTPQPPEPPVAGRVEETDAAVGLSFGWTQSNPNWFAWSGGTAVQSIVAGAQATLTFTGTSVTWIGNRNSYSGIALVKVDGIAVSEVDLFARPEEIHTPVFTVNDLSPGSHMLTIEVTGRKNPGSLGNPGSTGNVVLVDAFDVPALVVSHLQETDPDVVFTGVWAQADDTIAWSGGGVFTFGDPPVGGARVSGTPGAKATLAFRGTAISWSGYRGPAAGIALVSLDGGLANEVDTYSPTEKIQDIVFTKTGLTDTIHTLTIEATGRKNAASTGAQIVVDAFDVTTPGRRFQEEDTALAYSGNWSFGNRNRTWSEGTISQSNTPGAKVTFTFTGTSVSWIGCRKLSTGTADIFLDGVLVQQVDTYLPPPIEAYQTTVFRKDGLALGAHTLTIEVTGNDVSYTVVDAFDVRP